METVRRSEATQRGERVSPFLEAQVSRHPWFALILLAYAGLTAGVFALAGPRIEALRLLAPLDLLILAAASYRAGRIIALDDVTRPLRSPFVWMSEEEGELREAPAGGGFRGAVGCLLSCPDCIGFWIASLFVFAWIFWPGPTFAVAVLFAVAGFGQLFSAIAQFLIRRSQA